MYKRNSVVRKYKERILLNPTEVELHYLYAANELRKLA